MPGFRSLWQRRTADGLVTRHVDLRSRGLRFGDGIRVVLLSDVHARPDWFPASEVARVVDAVRAVEDVDLVAMVGDFTGDNPAEIEPSAREYARIEAPVVATLGNHDHWAGAHHATQALEAVGIDVLTNRALPLAGLFGERAGSSWLAGIDSCWTRTGSGPGADPAAAFADVPDDAEVLVLGHEPHIATLHEHALHLAGHTHCGQVRSPVFGDWTARLHMPRFSEPYPCRLYELGVEPPERDATPANHRTAHARRFVYTTAGVGFSTIDLRLFCPPEIVVIDC